MSVSYFNNFAYLKPKNNILKPKFLLKYDGYLNYSQLYYLADSKTLAIISKDGTPNLFKPWLMSSQPCVSYFKCACSFTSLSSTQLKLTLYNFLVHRCKNADAHIRLTGLGSTDNIVYPRHIKNQVRYGSFSTETSVCDTLPSVEGI